MGYIFLSQPFSVSFYPEHLFPREKHFLLSRHRPNSILVGRFESGAQNLPGDKSVEISFLTHT